MQPQTLYRTALGGLEKIHEGKVRDSYAVDADSLLIVTTDRLSAFDVVLPDPIPDKGRVVNGISNFWVPRTPRLVANHLTGRGAVEGGEDERARPPGPGRALGVPLLEGLPLAHVALG